MLSLPLLAAVVVALPAPPTLPPQLTLDEAIRIFRRQGLDLLIAEANVLAAEGDVRSAGAVPNPGLNVAVGGALPPFYHASAPGCDGCSAVSWTVGLSDNAALFDTVWGKRGLRRQVAGAALEAARMARADAQRVLEFQVKQQYIQAVQARDTLDFAREVQAAMTRTHQLTETRYHAGAISEADAAKVETAKLEADQAVDQAEQDLQTARVAVGFLLGVRGPIPDFQVDADLPPFVIPSALAQATREGLLREAVVRRADLKQAAHQRQKAELSVRAARRAVLPDVEISASFTAQGFGQTAIQPPTLTFGLALPVPIFDQNQGAVRHAQADERTQTILERKVETQVSSDVETAFALWTGTRRRLERMVGRLLDRSRRARDLIQLQYTKGAASLLEFLDAERTWIATNQEYLQDLAAYWTAVFQLEQATAMELR